MNFLKKAIQAKFGPKESLIEAMLKVLTEPQPARSHKVIHASDLTKEWFCPREVMMLEVTGKERKPVTLSPATAATFGQGNAIADLARHVWLKPVIHGNWKCLRCGSQVTGKYPDTKDFDSSCPHEWRYEEVVFISKTYGYSGSLDALVDLGAPKLTIVELKIIAPEMFADLTAPMAEHRLRTNLYMHLVEDAGDGAPINTQWSKILYISRGHGKKHLDHGTVLPFKEFDVERNDDDLKPFLARAKTVLAWRKEGVIPERLCQFSYQPEAKRCPVMVECFNAEITQKTPLTPPPPDAMVEED